MPALLLGFFFVLAASCVKYAPTEVDVAPGAPAPEAKALWSYITKDSPYTEWRMWPDKKALYMGTVPHGALLTTYVNGGARKAVIQGAGVMPNGAIIVKENYRPDKEMVAVTVMYKVAGQDPKNGDWFWAKYSPKGDIMVAGCAPMCIACHSGRKQFDYIMTK